MPSMPTHQLLSQGQQEGSQRPLPAPGCPPPPPLQHPRLSRAPVVSGLNILALLLRGATPDTLAPGLLAPPSPCGPGVAVASFCPWSPVPLPLVSSSVTTLPVHLLPSPSWEVYLAVSPLEPHSPGDREGQVQLEGQALALTQGRVSIPLCGHVSFHHLRGAGRPAPPESLSSFPSAHTECPQATYLQLREQDRCSGRSGRCTRSLGVRTGPCRQTDARVGAPDPASYTCDPAAQSPVATPVCSPGGCGDAGWCLLVCENHSLSPSLGAVPLQYDMWARGVGTGPLLLLPGSRAAPGPRSLGGAWDEGHHPGQVCEVGPQGLGRLEVGSAEST